MDADQIVIPPPYNQDVIGYRNNATLWLFAKPHFQPSYWLILKREGFSGLALAPLEEIDLFLLSLSSQQCVEIYTFYYGDAPSQHDAFFLMPQVRDLLQSHAVQTYYLLDPDGTHESRLGDVADSYYAMPEDLTPDTVRYFRNQLAESLGKQIASRWVGKVKADQQHFARHWLVQDLVEGYDIAAEVADTGWDFIKGLWDIGCLVVSLAGDAIVLQIKFHQQLMKSIGDLASGDLEAIEKDLNDAGIYLTQKLTSAQQLKATIERGYDTFQLLVDDAQTKQLIKDYFDSLYESTTYRDSRTIAVRVVAEIGLEVLIALATVGIGNVARRTGQAAHKADKAVDLVRAGEMVGPFTREAIEVMADLAHGLKQRDMSLPSTKPAKDIDVPDYAKPPKDKPKPKPQPKRMDPHEVECFTPGESVLKSPKFGGNRKKMEGEYYKQLKAQEDGLNKITVGEYLENREKYKTLGRDGVSNGAAQRATGNKLRKRLTDTFLEELITSGKASGKEALKQAKERAKKTMSNLAALHDPDMIAGGHDRINTNSSTGMGNSNINSSIGSQWKSRVSDLDEAAEKALKEHGPDAKMNVELSRCKF